MNLVVYVIDIFINVLIFAIFARSLVSWFPVDREGFVIQTLNALTDPILVPLRRIVPLIGMIDLTPMIAIFILLAVSRALQTAG